MSQLTDDLMKQLRFISEAGNYFMSQKNKINWSTTGPSYS
jgi:hypothetical protein